MPEKTLDAVADHGEITGDTVTGNYDDASAGARRLERARRLLQPRSSPLLESEGVDKFEKSWGELLDRRPGRAHRGREPTSGSSRGTAVSTSPSASVAAGAGGRRDRAARAALVEDQVASRLFAQDATLWGPDAEAESAIRLSWVGLPRSSRPLVGESSALRDAARAAEGVDHVVLCGMGGSSLAPEVICATAGVDLTVLDSTDPD